MVWYLIVPSKLSNINYDNNKTVLEYSEQLAAGAIDIANLKSQVESLETERDNLELQLSGYIAEDGQLAMYSMLVDAAKAYIDNDFTQAAVLLQKIDIALLPTRTAKDVYSTMLEYCSGGADKFVTSGTKAYMEGDYISAISYLSAARAYDDTDDEAAYYLGLSYEAAEYTDEAIAAYQDFLESFPQSEYTADVTARLAAAEAERNTEEQTEMQTGTQNNDGETESTAESTDGGAQIPEGSTP